MALEDGTLVVYHGSLKEYHGRVMAVNGTHRPYIPLDDNDTQRYILVYGSDEMDYLSNVRPQSFTVMEAT